MRGRSFFVAIAATLLLLWASVGAARAAILLATLSVEAAPAGADVLLQVEMTGREADERGSLFLVPAEALDATFPESVRCERIAGSTVLGDMTWHAAEIQFEGSSYPGFAGEARFTVPEAPLGDYYLAESREDEHTACFSFTSFAITGAPVPDTAMAGPKSPSRLVLATLLASTIGVVLRTVLPFRVRLAREGSPQDGR